MSLGIDVIKVEGHTFGISENKKGTMVEGYINKIPTKTFNELSSLRLPGFGYSPYGGCIKWKYDINVSNYTILEDIKKVVDTINKKDEKLMNPKEYINKTKKPTTEFEKSTKKLNEQLHVNLSDRYYVRDECVIKPSGMKFDGEKNRMNLIPPETLESIGGVLTYGANKYEPNNWKNIGKDRYTAALLRHLVDYMKDPKSTDESGYLHIEHVLANAVFLSYFETHKEELDGNNWPNKIKSL